MIVIPIRIYSGGFMLQKQRTYALKPEVLALMVIFSVPSMTLYAQSTDKVESADKVVMLDPINITAASQSSLSSTLINADELQRHQARSMADIFANQASVSVGGGARNAQRIYAWH